MNLNSRYTRCPTCNSPIAETKNLIVRNGVPTSGVFMYACGHMVEFPPDGRKRILNSCSQALGKIVNRGSGNHD